MNRSCFNPKNSNSIAVLILLISLFLQACSGDDYYENSGPYSPAMQNLVIPNSPIAEEENSAMVTKKVSMTLFYPKENNKITNTSEELTLILPASDLNRYFYLPLAWHLATHGHTVAAIDLPFNLSLNGKHDWLAATVTHVMDQLEASENLRAEISTEKVNLIGHGLGGKIAFYAATLDQRIQKVAALDPTNNGEAPCFVSRKWCEAYPVAPIPNTDYIGVLGELSSESLIFRSSPDIFFSSEEQFNAEIFFYGLDGSGSYATPSPSIFIDAGEQIHLSWLPLFGSDLNRMTFRTLTAWLDPGLSESDLIPYISGTVMQWDIDQGIVTKVDQR